MSPPAENIAHETSLAARNGVKLALSLFATLTIAVVVRFAIPRVLGPDDYGRLHFAESLAIMCFLLATLGVDTYLRKEAAVDLSIAERSFGGFLILRGLISIFVIAIMCGVLFFMDKDPIIWRVALLFAGWQLFQLNNDSVEGLLHAVGKVTRLAILRPVLKIMWGGAVVLCLVLAPRAEVIAAVFFGANMVNFVAFVWLVKKELNFRFRIDLGAAWAAVIASMGFFLNTLAHKAYEKLDVQMLTVMGDDKEVGYYGAAVNLALAGLIFIPVATSVLLPMAARIANQSEDSMNAVMRAAVRLMLVIGVIPSIFIALYAPLITELAFGAAFAPTAISLLILGFLFPLTYLAVFLSTHMIQLNRIWILTGISFVGLVANPALNLFAIPWGLATYGPGGGGAGAALATVLTEVIVVVSLFIALGRHGFERQTLEVLLKLTLLVGVVLGLHMILPTPAWLDLPLLGAKGQGVWRMSVEVLAFGLGALALGLIPKAALEFIAAKLRRERG